jgi:hypothetical protein
MFSSHTSYIYDIQVNRQRIHTARLHTSCFHHCNYRHFCTNDFVLFQNIICYTNTLLSQNFVNTIELLNITCILVTTSILLRSLESTSIFTEGHLLTRRRQHQPFKGQTRKKKVLYIYVYIYKLLKHLHRKFKSCTGCYSPVIGLVQFPSLYLKLKTRNAKGHFTHMTKGSFEGGNWI